MHTMGWRECRTQVVRVWEGAAGEGPWQQQAEVLGALASHTGATTGQHAAPARTAHGDKEHNIKPARLYHTVFPVTHVQLLALVQHQGKPRTMDPAAFLTMYSCQDSARSGREFCPLLPCQQRA